MRNTFGSEKFCEVGGVIRGGVEGNEDVGEKGFDVRLAGFANDDRGEIVASGEHFLFESIEERAASGDRSVAPLFLRGFCPGHDGGNFVWLRARNLLDDLAGGRIVRRKRVDGNGLGGHGEILAQGGCA